MRRVRLFSKLVRLEQEELDRRRRELLALDVRLAELREERERLRRSVPAEMAAGWALPGGPGPLGAWLAAARTRDRALARQIEELSARRERAAAAVRDKRAAKRRQEVLLERAEAEWRASAESRARKELDELAVLRHRRSGEAAT